jgi:UDP-N-acetylmuramoyl-L-alanyl-D-glutamate--2,6-diaminopimelate ligase
MTGLAATPDSSTGLTTGELARVLAPFGATLRGDAAVRVTGVRQDSRRIEQGDLFCARAGGRVSGLEHVAQAVERGAVALLVDHGRTPSGCPLPAIEVEDARRALAFAAEAVYGEPSRALCLVGVTGTNGKTTVSFLVEHALAALGQKPARLGTLGLSFLGRASEGALTTPEADDLSRTFAEIVGAGGSHVVMEVSSHALEIGRVGALRFRVGAFTNLTQDHLDFHGTMHAYGAAKRRLFEDFELDASVINVGDAFGSELGRSAKGRVIRVARAGDADIVVERASVDASGIRAELATPSGPVALTSPLTGEHNLENLLVALGVLVALGFEAEPAARALERAPQVPGRLERCDELGDDVSVFVDYAHTPDALERVLSALRRVSSGELVCVFGCGGDRDPGKRPKMGAAVAKAADRAFVTNDNPRGDDPRKIAEAIEPPLAESGIAYEIELDRAIAIRRAIVEAVPGATVLLAGKGHEPYQIIGAETRPFDDRDEARRALAARRARRDRA